MRQPMPIRPAFCALHAAGSTVIHARIWSSKLTQWTAEKKGLNIVEVQKATEDGHTRRPHWSCRSMHTHHHGVRRSHQVNKQAYDQSGVGCSFRDNEQTFTIRLRYMFNVIHSTQSRAHMTVHHHHLHHLHYHHLHLLLLVQCFILNLAFRQIISCKVWETFSFPNGLILRTFRPFNVFILLNGWICWHGVLDEVERTCTSISFHQTYYFGDESFQAIDCIRTENTKLTAVKRR